MRKSVVAAVVFVLFAAACGGGKKESALTTNQSGTAASPGAAASSSKPGATAAASKSASKSPAGTTASKTTGSSATSGGTAPAKVVAGGYSPPKDGSYVYRLDGEATNPFNPAAAPQKFSNETLTQKVSHSGNVITTVQTTSTQAGSTTQKLRWETTRIVLLYVDAQTAQGDYSCTFDPPLVIAHFPVHPETIPTQPFKGQGNACNGKLDITIERQEAAKDNNGRSWTAWRVRVRTQTTVGQFAQSSDETRWVAPAIGAMVRSQGTTQYTIQGTGGGHGSETAALKSYPK